MKTKKRSKGSAALQWFEDQIDMVAAIVFDPFDVTDSLEEETRNGITTMESIRIHATERR